MSKADLEHESERFRPLRIESTTSSTVEVSGEKGPLILYIGTIRGQVCVQDASARFRRARVIISGNKIYHYYSWGRIEAETVGAESGEATGTCETANSFAEVATGN